MRATVGRDSGSSWSEESSGCRAPLTVLRSILFSFSEFFPTRESGSPFSSFGCPTCESEPQALTLPCGMSQPRSRPSFKLPTGGVIRSSLLFLGLFSFLFSEMGARSLCEQGRCGGAKIRRYVCEVNVRVVVVVPLLLITSLWQRRKQGSKQVEHHLIFKS